MSVWRRSDGSMAIDIEGGPFLVLPASVWNLLCRRIRSGAVPDSSVSAD